MNYLKYDLWQAEREKAEVLNCGLKVLKNTSNPERPIVKIWRSKATKPYAHYQFRTIQQMEDYIVKQIESASSWEMQKKKRKAERQGTPEMLNSVREGMIFYTSWGYDQTNIDFYQVTRVSGKFAWLREVVGYCPANMQKPTSYDSSYTMAQKDSFVKDSKEMKKRIQFGSNGEPHFRIASYAYASLWDGRPKQYSWGH
jgi:hypothetical protein